MSDPARSCDWATSPVIARHKDPLTALSRPGDFETGPALPSRAAAGLHFIPYALDADRREIIETGLPRMPVRAPRPFFYLDLYEEAEHLRRIPVQDYPARAAQLVQAPAPERYVFIFTIGRARSTLVSRILASAGIGSVSEPDILVHLAQMRLLSRLGLSAEQWQQLYQSCMSVLEAAHGSPEIFALKLRSQCTNPFHLGHLIRMYPRARFVFLFRSAEDWSLSYTRKFGLRFRALREIMMSTLRMAQMVQRSGADLQILTHDQIGSDPTCILQGVAGDRKIAHSATALQAVMERDSQQGLFDQPHARVAEIDGLPPEHVKFMTWWRDNRPVALMKKLGLDL